MKALLTLTLFLFFITESNCQINGDLPEILDSLKQEDQKWRNTLRKIDNGVLTEVNRETVIRNMKITDSLNFISIQNLFEEYGFLGFSKVGKNGSYDFWLLVQHQDSNPEFQQSVLEAMKREAEKNNASWTNYAYLLDRVKVNTGQLQVYGTQMKLNSDSTSFVPKEMIEPKKINERRFKVGLSPIEEYIKTMNSRYFGSLKK